MGAGSEPCLTPCPPRAGFRIGALSLAALLFASALLLDLAYAFNGSFEMFPSAEQQGTFTSPDGVHHVNEEHIRTFVLTRRGSQ